MKILPNQNIPSGRAKAEAEAREMGINEELISNLVDSFYSNIQENEELGPIFEKVVQGNWGPHLEKMKDFWSSVVLYSGKYHGRPMPIHKRLTDVNPQHFGLWLSLFNQTLKEVSPSENVTQHFMLKAEQIAGSLQAGMFEKRVVMKND